MPGPTTRASFNQNVVRPRLRRPASRRRRVVGVHSDQSSRRRSSSSGRSDRPSCIWQHREVNTALRRILLMAVTCLVVAGHAHAQSASSQASQPLTDTAAIERALSANPTIAAARLRRSVNVASRDVAAERLNPEFRAEFAKETPKEGYTLAVPWETAGKRGKRIAVSDAAIATGDAEVIQTIAEVQADVRHAFVARFAAESRRTLLEEVQGLAQRARDAAQARFDAGDAPRLEVLQAQLALDDVENQMNAARGASDAARLTLNALLGFPLDEPTPIEMRLDVGPSLPADAAIARAQSANTELAVLDRRLAEQRARVTLAHALRQPDVTPEATLTRRAEPEFSTGWRAAIAVSIPILTTHAAGVR